MNVLVLGGTGSIGAAVVSALRRRHHAVLALSRSETAAAKLRAAGCTHLPGNLVDPGPWADAALHVDAVIQVASDFSAESDAIDRRLLDALLPRLAGARHRASLPAYLYTGGCWLYGATGAHLATEETPLNPPPEWAWSLVHLERVRTMPGLRGIVIHPAMVYERGGGVLAQFRRDLETRGHIRIIGGPSVRWPMVHRVDIGDLYARALERAPAGAVFNGAACASVEVGALARAMTRAAGLDAEPVPWAVASAVNELGSWASGYAIDQGMSGEKARRDLGWAPVHRDPIADVSAA